VARAEAGERRAQATLEQVGEYLGIGNIISGLGIPHAVVSGRIVEGWKFLRDPLHKAVERTMAGRLTKWEVEAGGGARSRARLRARSCKRPASDHARVAEAFDRVKDFLVR
jgi:predicted NBD/HSP70 family sugar kinase